LAPGVANTATPPPPSKLILDDGVSCSVPSSSCLDLPATSHSAMPSHGPSQNHTCLLPATLKASSVVANRPWPRPGVASSA
jgi:hypothetical protein